jgi:hypothetical protein
VWCGVLCCVVCCVVWCVVWCGVVCCVVWCVVWCGVNKSFRFEIELLPSFGLFFSGGKPFSK